MMMEWHELTEEERIKEVYSKFTISDFFKWWQNETSNIMEIRIKDFALIKQISEELSLPYSASGIYISNEKMLKEIIRLARDKSVMWWGYNDRKKAYNSSGYKWYGGSTVNVNCINGIFLDIDRINKIERANNEELKKCDMLANKIIEKMNKEKWAERYIKICSGNGMQLFFPFDVPIKMPNPHYDFETKAYDYTEEYEIMNNLLRMGIGKDIIKFCNTFKDELNVNLDISCFKLAGVASLPFTKNYKFGGFTWRGIIELKHGVNVGLTDYVLSKQRDIKLYKEKNPFVKNKGAKKQNLIKSEDLEKHPLIRFMLDNDLPHGRINNLLWMQVKCLLRDNKLNFKDENVRKIHKELEIKYKDVFTTNFPDKNYEYKEEIINRYCADNLIPPLFSLSQLRPIKEKFLLTLNWDMLFIVRDESLIMDDGIDIFEDMRELKKILLSLGKGTQNNYVYRFTNGCIKKYGIEKTKYFFDNWFLYYFGYRS